MAGGFHCLWRSAVGMPRLVRATILYAVAMAAGAVAPDLRTASLCLPVVGAVSITFLTMGHSAIQLAADPQYRGRVTALWPAAFLGTTPVGAPLIGLAASESPRLALAIGATACVAATVIGRRTLRRDRAQVGVAVR